MSGPCPECAGCGWVPYPTEAKDGGEEWAWRLCGEEHGGKPLPPSPEKRNDLWRIEKSFDYGPEKNLEVWSGAAQVLEGLAQIGDALGSEGVVVGLTDATIRAQEEVRRHRSEVRMRREWAEKQPTEADLL
jgi:hypothetical protein